MSKSALIDDESDDDDDDMFGGNDGHINKESLLLDDRADSQYFNVLNNSNHLQHQQHSQNVSKILDNQLDISDVTGQNIGNMIVEEGQNDAGDDEEAPLIAADQEDDEEDGSNVSWGIPEDAEQHNKIESESSYRKKALRQKLSIDVSKAKPYY